MPDPTKISTARQFWDQVVQPDHAEFRADTADRRKAMHCALTLYHLYEWVFEEHKADSEKVFGCGSVRAFRTI